MTEFKIREYRNEDIPALIKLWHQVFGDPESLIKEFFRLLPHTGTGHLAEVDGELAGAAYMLRGLDYVNGTELIPCGYVYAVATDRRFRGMGIGAALSKAAAHSAGQWHAKAVCTLPAEDSLYPWYEKLIGVKAALYRKRTELACAALLPCLKVSAADYLIRREDSLAGKPHLSVSLHNMDFQRLLCETYGGGLFMGDAFMGFGYKEEDCAIIKELICDDELKQSAAASIGFSMGAARAVLFEPSHEGEKYIALDTDGFAPDSVWNISFD